MRLLFPGQTGRWSRRILLFLVLPYLCLYWLARLFPPDLETGYSTEILDRDGRLLQAFLSPDDKWRLRTPPDQLPPRLTRWILDKEDRYFYWHPGINPVSVINSLLANLKAGRIVSGASTITMQAVRLARPAGRTWKAKAGEAFLALWWEMALSKDEILAYYLSRLPFGGNVEGFRAASRIYFGKEPGDLSPGEASSLIVIPNHPGKFHPLRQPGALEKKRRSFLDRQLKAGYLTTADWQLAVTEPVHPRFHAMPALIPHLSRELGKEAITGRLQTTLSAPVQSELQHLLLRHLRKWKPHGVGNAAALLADARTGEILAWIGNADWNDSLNSGQMDAVRALRSPGSTLKPFLFARALESGRITPATRLPDMEEEFGTYHPENFDLTFRGLVRADQALLQSLNLPAIHLLKSIGPDTLEKICRQLGMAGLMGKEEKPGLSLAVGGCQTSLAELVSAYTIFQNGGRRRILRVLKEPGTRTDTQAVEMPLTPAALQMVRYWLALPRRGEAIRNLARNPAGFHSVFWKTGTSFGRKDAWCLGGGNRYVLGLWFGNLSGTGVPVLSGTDVAAPLFQEMITRLEQPGRPGKQSHPEGWGWKVRQVCRETGLPPGTGCTELEKDFFLPLISPMNTCTHMTTVPTNTAGSISYCRSCLPEGEPVHSRLYFQPVPGWLEWCRKSGRPETRPLAPPHNSACTVWGASGLEIVSPAEGRRYRGLASGKVPVTVQVRTRPDGFPVQLFLDGRPSGTFPENSLPILNLESGKHTLQVQDRFGKSRSVSFRVDAGAI